MKPTQDKKKSYVYLKRSWKELKVSDHVYLRVKPKKSSLKLESYSKLEPRYCGPFEFLDTIGTIAYKIALLAKMRAHNVFHVSLLKKYVYWEKLHSRITFNHVISLHSCIYVSIFPMPWGFDSMQNHLSKEWSSLFCQSHVEVIHGLCLIEW